MLQDLESICFQRKVIREIREKQLARADILLNHNPPAISHQEFEEAKIALALAYIDERESKIRLSKEGDQ